MQDRLDAAIAAHKVPGAVFGILSGDDIDVFAAGVTNKRTGVEVTDDTLFQIGSITKVWTATLVMMLVDDGVLDLDEPVITYLPELQVADPDVTKRVTLRDLLSHRSGIAGDHFVDTGRGDDVLEKFVAACTDLGQEHDLGATMSYCNAGYSITGRVIEKVTGKTWDEVLRERLITPLGLTHTNTLAEEAILHRVAVGHLDEDTVAPIWVLPRSAGPAGLINATAGDLLAFAKLHLDGGRAPDGTQLVSVAAVKQMQEGQIDVPDTYTLGDRWGLGWILFEWDGQPVFGHDGGTIGQRAYLRVFPGASLAVCMLTNGGESGNAFKELCDEVISARMGIHVPKLPDAPATPPDVDLSKYEGRFERFNVGMTLTRDGDAISALVETWGPLSDMLPDEDEDDKRMTLVPVDASLFLATSKKVSTPTPVVFFDFDGDMPRRLHYGARAMVRRSDA
jgi:CubicO group peptidase (beta-lactamase class C family)